MSPSKGLEFGGIEEQGHLFQGNKEMKAHAWDWAQNWEHWK